MKNTRNGKRLPITLTKAEEQALLAQVNTKSTTGLRNRAMIAAMLGAGLRVSEVVALKPAEVDFQRGEVRVNLGKGGKDRVVPVDAETLGWLRAWSEKRNALKFSGRAPLFCAIRRTPLGSKPGQGITARTVQALIRRLAREAGIDKQVTPHTLRHTFATRALDASLTIREVQELLGHSDVSTTMIYTHVNPEALRRKIQGQPGKTELQEQIAALQTQLDELQQAAADVENHSNSTQGA